jgi:hypothetical protein
MNEGQSGKFFKPIETLNEILFLMTFLVRKERQDVVQDLNAWEQLKKL